MFKNVLNFLWKTTKIILTFFCFVQQLDEDNLFDEFSHVEQIFKSWIHEWQTNSAKVEVKWCEIFECTKAHYIDTNNISKIVEYSLAIPGTNAAVERIF